MTFKHFRYQLLFLYKYPIETRVYSSIQWPPSLKIQTAYFLSIKVTLQDKLASPYHS